MKGILKILGAVLIIGFITAERNQQFPVTG